MKEVILFIAERVNQIHDILQEQLGLHMSDKAMHFWVLGLIGMVSFFFVFLVFRWIARFKWHISIIAFLYTLTMMVVLVFAIEIQQAITNRGNMEFADAIIGLWGFIIFFLIYAVLAISAYFLIKSIRNRKRRKKPRNRSHSRYRQRSG